MGDAAVPLVFFFGDPSFVAFSLYEEVGKFGPGIPWMPVDEMTEEDLRDALTYLRMAYNTASRNGHPDEVLDYIQGDYDKVFVELVRTSKQFARFVKTPGFGPIGKGERSENRTYYKRLVRDALGR